ncbi:response regulator [Paenibacillus baekrokdamisoli]|nr:response regulator transcription factor [Paenibacillus baekrokdamisoli]
MTEQIRVLLADDHPHGREGMREIVGMDASFIIIGEAENGEQATVMAAELRPQLILMDINMPVMNGMEATQMIKTIDPQIKIIMVTVSDDISDLFEAIKRGAQGYLLKNLSPSAWLEYLRAVAVDEAPLSKELAFRMLQEFNSGRNEQVKTDASHSDKGKKAKIPAAALPLNAGSDLTIPTSNNSAGLGKTPLTQREREVLEQVAAGHSNRQIAEAFMISEHTIKNHLKNILQKLHLDNRVQLTRYALEKGLLDK